MKNRYKICLLLACFCAGIGVYHLLPKSIVTEINASTAYISLEEMVVKADLIVTCNVSDDGVSDWDRAQDGRTLDTIHTDVPVEAQEMVVNRLDEEADVLSIRTHVGEIGRQIQTSTSYPSLTSEEETLLFLVQGEDGTYYDILGLSQGKFIRTEVDGMAVYTNGRDELPVDGLSDVIAEIAEEYADYEWPSDYYTPEEIEEMNNALFHVND